MRGSWAACASALAAAALASIAVAAPVTDVELALVMWRHGDRSPVECFPATVDLCAERWPQGFGMLTAEGMELGLALGKALRTRYSGSLIRPNYTRTDITVRSSDFDRTLMTAQAVMQGLYPPGSGPQTKDGKNGLTPDRLQPVPEHTVQQSQDTLLLAYEAAACPAIAAADAEEQKMHFKEWDNIQARWSNIRPLIQNVTGLTDDQTTLGAMYAIWDLLVCEMAHDYDLIPALNNATLLTEMQEIADFTLAHLFASQAQQRLAAGRLVAEFSARFVAAVNNGTQPGWNPQTFPKPDRTRPDVAHGPRFWGYSAHDATIVALLQALGAYDGVHPPYASSVALELIPVKKFDSHSVRGGASALSVAPEDLFAVRGFYNTNQSTGSGAFGPEQAMTMACSTRIKSANLIQSGAIPAGSCIVSDFVAGYAPVSMPGDTWKTDCALPSPSPTPLPPAPSASPSPGPAQWSGEQIGATVGSGIGGLVLGSLVAVLIVRSCRPEERRSPTMDTATLLF